MEPGAHAVSVLVLQLAVIVIAARCGGELVQRLFRQPPVLGELLMGIIIGPFALGALPLPLIGPLFPRSAETATIPVSSELYAVAQLGAVVLLFASGLETDRNQFFRQGPAAFTVAAGGVILPFIFGAGATWLMGFAESITAPAALFVGSIMTATSVGITARALSELGKLDTPEGVTVLGAAVIDDVLGILVLAVVLGIATSGSVSAGEIALIGGRALGVWLLLTAVLILLGKPISRFFSRFQTEGADLVLALGVGFLAAVIAESAGLAMIIGAYSAGLALSDTPIAHRLRESIGAIYQFLAPVFFVVMGMLVDIPAIGLALGFGIVITLLAILGKVVGCAVPALAVGFNRIGALRIGWGMLPRGEVALIVAGVGLTAGLVSSSVFGVAVLMTVVTTLLAPPLLVASFRNPAPGTRRSPVPQQTGMSYQAELPTDVAALFRDHFREVMERSGFHPRVVGSQYGPDVLELSREDDLVAFVVSGIEEGRCRVEIVSETVSFREEIVTAATSLAMRGVEHILAPLGIVDVAEVSDRVRSALPGGAHTA